jgi:hypothetical protein
MTCMIIRVFDVRTNKTETLDENLAGVLRGTDKHSGKLSVAEIFSVQLNCDGSLFVGVKTHEPPKVEVKNLNVEIDCCKSALDTRVDDPTTAEEL